MSNETKGADETIQDCFKDLLVLAQRVASRTMELIWSGHRQRKRVTGEGYPIVKLVKGEDMSENTGQYMIHRGVPVMMKSNKG